MHRLAFPALAVLAFLVLLPAQAADDDLNVLKAGDAPRKMLSEYLLAQAKTHFDQRRQVVGKLTTADEIKARQDDLRAKFTAALGGFPERTPLNGQVIGTDQRDGYRVEKVIYESRPAHHVTANLYLPEGKGPHPGVIVPCGHSTNGKAAEAYQRVCILLAKNGVAALIYDPIGQGERVQLLDPPGKPVTGSTNEHTLVTVGAMLVGECTASYRVWDGIRSLDYLAARPEIDPKRLGCTGNSGGGTLTSYLMALDDRIGPAAPSCYIMTLEKLFTTLGPQDGEQNIPGQVAFGMEHADYVTMRAPKPTLILTATQDFFDIGGSWTAFREAKQIFGKLGYSERVDLAEYNTKHGYGKGQRESMVRFMRRHLLNKGDIVFEDNFAAAKDKDIQCTRTGQVLEDFKGRNVFDFTADKAKQLAAQRAKANLEPAALQKEVRKLLALDVAIKPAKVQDQSKLDRADYELRKVVYETEPGIKVPALRYVPKKRTDGPLVLYIHELGKNAAGAACEELVKQGREVLALDPRGVGETAPAALNPAKPGMFGVDFKESFLAVHLNRPLLGQKVYDVLAVLEAQEGRPCTIVGVGNAGPIALHAAAVDPRIKETTLDQALISWADVARTPVTANQLTNVVPGALKTYDLPELAAVLAPRPLTIRNAVDAQRKGVSSDAAAQAYAPCKAAYTKANAEKQFTLQTGP